MQLIHSLCSPVALLYPSLNKLNAKFVDIIHTDRYKIGEDYSAGHMDFWPNTGAYQPGCSIFCDTQDYNCLACSHNRVLKYYTESIQSGSVRKFKSNLCSGLGYDIGLCFGSVASMGFYADKYSAYPGNYYLSTNDVSPYSISNV
ncbi:hypothetical protein PVAND_015213 [Polypedilum vanderplanki]|uniref:Lipase domain-containing protein n=1 Tax=Polypedilum vanderplanki TaxID=319348 RepID=A0A9J6BCB8_POLVA|nr:hypothetical protein PVAND_015213 [Polypedilum vanderplanki]